MDSRRPAKILRRLVCGSGYDQQPSQQSRKDEASLQEVCQRRCEGGEDAARGSCWSMECPVKWVIPRVSCLRVDENSTDNILRGLKETFRGAFEKDGDGVDKVRRRHGTRTIVRLDRQGGVQQRATKLAVWEMRKR